MLVYVPADNEVFRREGDGLGLVLFPKVVIRILILENVVILVRI